MKRMFTAVAVCAFLISCKKSNETSNTLPEIKTDSISVSNHKLATFYTGKNSKYLVVFESGMGDDHSVWLEKKIAENVSAAADILMYDRAGYGKSTIEAGNPSAKNINQVRTEFETVINKYANGRKVILVGHSIAGIFLRNYVANNTNKVAGLVLIDPSHEKYQDSARQDIEDILYYTFATNFGANSGAAREADQFMEYIAKAGTLPKLPNVPVVVFTSMRKDDSNNFSDTAWGRTRQDWFSAHESLKNGVTDFTHISTLNSGHYIMKDEPLLVQEKVLQLIAKLP